METEYETDPWGNRCYPTMARDAHRYWMLWHYLVEHHASIIEDFEEMYTTHTMKSIDKEEL
jgi:hypothetical protein